MLKLTAVFKVTLFFAALLFYCGVAIAQITSPPPQPPHPQDTLREIEIIEGRSLRKIFVDSLNRFQTIAGNVKMKEGLTLFTCDSAAINELTRVMESFGNVHINQNDSINTYAQYLKYIGAERIAYLKKDVRLTDKKGTLFTQELEYDLKTNIGKYKNGGKVINGKTTLVSEEGVYYADTHDVYFKKKVHLTDPKYDIDSDSLLYNTQTQVVTFITATHIISKEGGDIYTSSGNYDLKSGKAYFGNRTVIKDSNRIYVADNVAIDEKSKTAQLEGHAVIRDTVSGYTIMGGQIYSNTETKSFLATRKPVLIFKGEGNDSTFVSADTLFSGISTVDKKGDKVVTKTDTLKTTTIISDSTVANSIFDDAVKGDTTALVLKDSTVRLPPARDDILTDKTTVKKDSLLTGAKKIFPKATDTAIAAAHRPNIPDSIGKADSIKKDTALVISDSTARVDSSATDSALALSIGKKLIKKDTSIISVKKDSAIRFFLAFHHVRIFNDSLQSVCDSLYYSSEDSVFRLYKDPLVFSSKSQISGDTINLYTKNKKVDRVYVFDNGLLINEIKPNMYNQMGGRTLNGYFKDGTLDYMRVKGSPAESIFFPQDKDSAFTGMNRAKGDVIDIYFINKEVNKVKFINDVDGVLYPIRQIPDDQKYLNKFKWWESRRPKSKWELFE